MNMQVVVGNQAAQVEHICIESFGFQHVPSDLCEPEGLGHLSRACAVIAIGAADQQNTGACAGILLHRLGNEQAVPGLFPFDRKLVIVIGKFQIAAGPISRSILRARITARAAFCNWHGSQLNQAFYAAA